MTLFDPSSLSVQPEGALPGVASSAQLKAQPSDGLLNTAQSSQNIAFVDAGLDYVDTLIQGLENTQVVLINSDQDGIAQITRVLATQQNLDSVQIFSHGMDGSLQLGDAVLSGGTITGYASQLEQWRGALADQADVMLYGCNLAGGGNGLALLSRISDLTGADVAASDDLTGQGGDWDLEVAVGSIEAAVALTQTAQATYEGTLALLNNGDFEQTLNGWFPFTGTETVSTAESFSGNASLQLSAAGSGVNQTMDVLVGESYTFTGNAKSSSSGYTAVGINFFDENYNYLDGASQAITVDDWSAFQLESTAVAGSRYVQFWAYKDTAAGDFFVDNLVADTDGVTPPPPTPPSSGTELLINSGFESGLSSWSGFTGSEAVSTVESFAGGSSLQLSDATSGTSQLIDTVVAGEDYSLSAYAKSSSNNYVGLGINFFDSNFNVLAGGVGQRVTSADWQQYQATTTAPAGASYVQVWTYKSDETGDAFLDEISLTSGGTTPPPSDTTAPTANLSASNVLAVGSSYDFTVTYEDASAVDVSSLDGSDIQVTGPNGFSQAASLVSVNQNGDGTPRIATYRITPPGGDWAAADNGTYAIALAANQVADTAGNTVSAANLGSFTVTVEDAPPTDTAAPTASLSVSDVLTAGDSYDFTVTYADESAIDVSSLDGSDIRVTGPNGFSQAASLVSVNQNGDGTPRTATYRITPPSGSWTQADNGAYSVDLVANQVADTVGNTVSAASLGSFDVSVSDGDTSGVVFFDDFETNQGWTTNPNNTDTATTGQWEVANPQQTSSGDVVLQQGTTVSGSRALVTQALAGNSVGTYDIDNGLTSTRSPDIVLANNANFTVDFNYAFGHLRNTNDSDFLRVSLVGENSSQVLLEQRGDNSVRAAAWTNVSADISNFAGQTVNLLVEAQDGSNGSFVEAAIDDVTVISSEPVADTEAPSPSLTAREITIEGTTTYDFEVTYSDNTAVDVSTIGAGDIRVAGPNGYSQTASFVSLDNNSDGSPRTATYRLNAPGGTWDGDDNGLYTVFLEGNQVTDVSGNAVSTTAAIGDFTVNLESNVLPLGDLFSGVVARDNATGSGYLMYSEELVAVRFLGNGPAAGNAGNLVAVSYDNGQWFYDNDNSLVAFTPRDSDRLLAQLDFSADTATLLVGTNQTINGIAAGYASGDLMVTPNTFGGINDPGEFGLSGSQVLLYGNGSSIPGQITFDTSSVSVNEDTGSVNLTVSRVGGSDGQVTVDYSTTDVSATAGDDFNAASGTLTFNAGQTQQTISIGIINDTVGEDDEAFAVTLNNTTGGSSIGLGSTVVTINENDGGSNPVGSGDLLPDLRPIANTSNDYRIDTNAIPGQVLLRLSTEVANVGDGPLELWGTDTDAASQPVFQRLYDAEGGSRDVLAGEFVNYSSHGHFHFEAFAVYNLREINADGSAGAIVASGGKTSFCLINVKQPFPDQTAAAVVADGRGGDDCGFVQGVDVGYSDVYSRNLPNQWVDVTNVADGDYLLEITTDPDNKILETDETNNTDYLQITLDNPRFG